MWALLQPMVQGEELVRFLVCARVGGSSITRMIPGKALDCSMGLVSIALHF